MHLRLLGIPGLYLLTLPPLVVSVRADGGYRSSMTVVRAAEDRDDPHADPGLHEGAAE